MRTMPENAKVCVLEYFSQSFYRLVESCLAGSGHIFCDSGEGVPDVVVVDVDNYPFWGLVLLYQLRGVRVIIASQKKGLIEKTLSK